VESVDWQTALGTAATAPYNPTVTPWQSTTGSLLGVGLAFGPGYSGGANTLLRVDNFFRYEASPGFWKAYNASGSPYSSYNTYMGMFDALPDAGAGSPGDHLISAGSNHPIEIQFDRGINGVMFRVSTPTSGDVHATIQAYAVQNPGLGDIPIYTYSIIATNASGLCATLNNGNLTAPTPCNSAPYIGIEGMPQNIRSVVVSTTDAAGLLIGGLYLDDTFDPGAPEPATFTLFGGALAAFAVMARRKKTIRK